ncbi:MAG: DUF4198 domain-containing protein [Bacteroidota bacterium]
MRLYKKVVTATFKGKFFKPFYLALAFIVLCSHNLYIKMETYFLEPNQEATLSLYNGTFETSENIITRDRILDASLISQGERLAINPDQWKDQDSTITQLTFNTGKEGTYVAGVSTKAKNIELTAEKFNNYLEHDGVLDMLEQRTNNNTLDQDAVESYQKHIKAIYQVGDTKTNDWNTVLGYPIEFVPQSNPYEKFTGETLDVKLLLDGKPLSNQLVYAHYIKSAHSHEHKGHEHDHDGKKHSHKHKDDDGKHSHEHDHNGKKHTHKHKDDDGKHSHDHDGKKHTHGHKHDDEKHTHEHEHDGKKHSHKHKHDDGKHSHDHKEKKQSHKHKHDDSKHSHSDKSKSKEGHHTHTDGQQLRTNDQCVVSVNLPEDGIYYLRTIHMVNVTDNDELTHRSKWATLTFEVTHRHDETTHTHHDHDHEDGIPLWYFIVGSLLVIVLLFLVFRKKN